MKIFLESFLSKGANGYHYIYKKYDDSVESFFLMSGYEPNNHYIDFIKNIGVGRFYDGLLIFFEVNGNDSLIKTSDRINEQFNTNIIIIGYDGTSSGYYCLKNSKQDNAIYWISSDDGQIGLVNHSFSDWLDKTTVELFDHKSYAGFKQIKNLDAILDVIEQRKKIIVKLEKYGKDLVKLPGREKVLLARYSKLWLNIEIKEQINIEKLTIRFRRTGNKYEDRNIQYLTIDISNLNINQATEFTGYIFDSYAVPFDKIICLYKPEIDLGSKNRSMFKEILDFL